LRAWREAYEEFMLVKATHVAWGLLNAQTSLVRPKAEAVVKYTYFGNRKVGRCDMRGKLVWETRFGRLCANLKPTSGRVASRHDGASRTYFTQLFYEARCIAIEFLNKNCANGQQAMVHDNRKQRQDNRRGMRVHKRR
jgi:hypothetical protein